MLLRPADLRAVAGTPGDRFPHRVIDLVDVVLDREFPAARRAAQNDLPSADLEEHVLAAGLALHQAHTLPNKIFLATDGH